MLKPFAKSGRYYCHGDACNGEIRVRPSSLPLRQDESEFGWHTTVARYLALVLCCPHDQGILFEPHSSLADQKIEPVSLSRPDLDVFASTSVLHALTKLKIATSVNRTGVE